MTRTTEEWIGKSDDQPFPPRVRLRIFERANGRCEHCGRKIGPADKWQADHRLALVNGGENRESNGQCLCDWCHKAKTAEDVAFKAKSARIRMRQAGIKAKKKAWPSRSFNSPPVSNTRQLYGDIAEDEQA